MRIKSCGGEKGGPRVGLTFSLLSERKREKKKRVVFLFSSGQTRFARNALRLT
jgi:hypothetical protein